MLLVNRRLGPKSDHVKTARIIQSAQGTFTRFGDASAQEVEMLRRQLDELTAQMIEIRQQASSTAMHAAVARLTEAVSTMGQ